MRVIYRCFYILGHRLLRYTAFDWKTDNQMSQTNPHTLTSIKIKFHQIVNTWCHSIALEKGTRITGQRYSFWTLYSTLLMTSDNFFLKFTCNSRLSMSNFTFINATCCTSALKKWKLSTTAILGNTAGKNSTTYIIRFLFDDCTVFLFDFRRPISTGTFCRTGTISISGEWHLCSENISKNSADKGVHYTWYKTNLTASTVQCTVWKTIFIGDLVTTNNQFGFKKQLSSSHAVPILHLPTSKLNKSASRAPVVSYPTLSFLPSANSAGVKMTPANFNDEKLFTM